MVYREAVRFTIIEEDSVRIHQATAGIVTRRRFVAGAAATAGAAILAACSVDTGPTSTAAPLPTVTATVISSPTRAGGIASVATGSGATTTPTITATRAVTAASVTTGSATTITATRATGSTTAGSATTTATTTASRAPGSASAAAGGNPVAGGAVVRVVHGSPDAPAVDVYVDGKKAITALAFGKASDYQPVTAGRHDFQVYATGADPTKDKPVIDGRGTSVGADARLSIIALDKLSNIKGLLADDRTATPATGKAKVKFIHAAPDAPSVDIAVKGGPVLFANTEFGKAYPYQELDAKTYDLEVRLAGKTDVVLSVPGVAFTAGTVYSIYAVGLVNGTPKLSAALFVDNPTR